MQTHEKRLWKGPSRLSNKVTIDELNTSATLQVRNKVVYELPLPVIVPEKKSVEWRWAHIHLRLTFLTRLALAFPNAAIHITISSAWQSMVL